MQSFFAEENYNSLFQKRNLCLALCLYRSELDVKALMTVQVEEAYRSAFRGLANKGGAAQRTVENSCEMGNLCEDASGLELLINFY